MIISDVYLVLYSTTGSGSLTGKQEGSCVLPAVWPMRPMFVGTVIIMR
jgi:hypothetical protein